MSDAISDSADLQVLMAWSRTVLAQAHLESVLVIDGMNEDGYSTATNTLSYISFDINDKTYREAVPQIEGLPGAGHCDLELWAEKETDGLHLVFGEQRFGLLFGEAAYRALQQAIADKYGMDLHGLLAQQIDCPSVALKVSKKMRAVRLCEPRSGITRSVRGRHRRCR